jgi:hypothetical protein
VWSPSGSLTDLALHTLSRGPRVNRYLAPMAGVMPSDPLEAAVADAYFEASQARPRELVDREDDAIP